MENPYESEYFAQAQGLVQLWPEDKTIPARLAALYKESEQHPAVGLFIEALYPPASGDDLELIAEAFRDED